MTKLTETEEAAKGGGKEHETNPSQTNRKMMGGRRVNYWGVYMQRGPN